MHKKWCRKIDANRQWHGVNPPEILEETHTGMYLLYLAMFAFHFAWYLSHFGISTFHLHGICMYLLHLVLEMFMWVSRGFFRVSFKVSFRVSFGFSLGFHLGFL